MTRKLSFIVVLCIAIISIFATAYCFAETTYSLTLIDDSSSLNIDSILNNFSSEYLSQNENEDVVVIATYSDNASHDITADLSYLGVETEKRYTYSEIFSGESFSIKLKDIISLQQISYISSVELANVYYALTDDASTSYSYSTDDADTSGIFKNNTLYQGDGMVVAIIDAAFDTSHVAFSQITSSNLALTLSDISSILYDLNSYSQSGASAQSLYVSDKIAYAYDYGEGDTNLYDSTINHGTHVSGIISANSSSLSGVVKNAQLALMKVADADGYMYNDTIVSALEDCLKLNVDVVNMSLGSNAGFENDDSALQKAVKALEENGISVICAAGNSYTSAYGGESGSSTSSSANIDNAAIGSPASYDESIAIANAGQKRWIVINEGEDNEARLLYSNMYSTALGEFGEFASQMIEYFNTNSLSYTQEYIILKDGDNIAIGEEDDYEDVDVSGKIVVVLRGDITFEAKIANAKSHGAVGVIVVNNSSTAVTPSVTNLSIPACIVEHDLEEVLINAATSNIGQITFDLSYVQVVLASSSSSGVTEDLNLGVDVTGYGTIIYSTDIDQGYCEMSGTSMASPNVAGVFTAVRQYIKENASIFSIDASDKVTIATLATRLIMSNTDLISDIDGIIYSPRSQGAGLAQLEDAVSSKAYISVENQTKTKIELGDELLDTFELVFTVENYNTFDLNLTLSIDVLTELLVDGRMSGDEKILDYEITSISGATLSGDDYIVSVLAQDIKEVCITINLAQSAITYLNQYENGIYLEGYIKLDDLMHSITLSCPYVGFYGDWDAAPMLDIDAYDESDDNTAEMRANTAYGIYAGSYYMPLGQFAFVLQDDYDGDEAQANEEFASLSIYSSSMYALGFIQLGLLRNAEYIEVEVLDMNTSEVIYSTSTTYESKTTYYSSYGILYGGNLYMSVSPYALDLYNNEQYQVIVSVYRTFDASSNENVISDTFTQKFYVDEESPEIEDVQASEENGKYYATFTLSDNHYIQALAICTGTGSSVTNVTLNVEDIYPIAIEADGVGQSTTVKYDVTDAVKNAENGYIYFYVADYAFNTSVYYYSVQNWTGVGAGISSKSNSSSTTDSSRPSTESTVSTSFEFTQSEIDVSVNKEVDLANTQYLSTYSSSEKYTWFSSDTSVVVVKDGKITGLQEGVAVVTVTDSSNNEASIVVKSKASSYDGAAYKATTISSYTMVDTITEDETAFFGFSISSSLIELAPGESFSFNYSYSPYNYNYIQSPITIEVTSSDTSVVTYLNGVISAEGEGDATLNIKANSTIIATYNVKVVPDVYKNDDGILLACFSDETNINLYSITDIIAIGANAFSYAKNAQQITLPQNCTIIYDNAFKGNTTITQVNGIENVTYIGANAFLDCTALTSIDLTNVTYIGANAFNGALKLSEVIFDSSTLENIGIESSAFLSCTKLDAFTISGESKTSIVVDGELVLTLNIQNALLDTSIKVIGSNALANVNVAELDLSSTAIERIEAGAFKGNNYLKKIKLPSTLKYIGKEAFSGCKKLTNVIFSKSSDMSLTIATQAFYLTSIYSIDLSNVKTTFGDEVFANCSSLTYVDMGIVQDMGSYTFSLSQKIQNVKFDEGTKYIGEATFAPTITSSSTYYHSALRYVTVPSSVIEIKDRAFAYCYSLSFAYMDLSNVTYIGEYAFIKNGKVSSLELDSIETLGYAAFAQSSIQSIKLNTSKDFGTLTIGELAFYECEYLSTVLLPDSDNVEVEILKGAFYNCTNLDEYAIRDHGPRGRIANGINFERVTYIGEYAFTGATSLSSATLSACTEIGYAAFAECEKLASITMPVIEKIGGVALYNTSITTLTIPNTIINIDQAAFCNTEVAISLDSTQDYSSNDSIKLDALDGGNAVYIKLSDGTYMLLYYPSDITLNQYTVLDNTSIIGAYAFLNNDSLVNVILPSSIKTIGHGAFYLCDYLGVVTYKGTSVPKLLSQYSSSSSSLYCNFVDYVSNSGNIVLAVSNSDIVSAFENNKTWNNVVEYTLVESESANIINFLVKVKALNGAKITSDNQAQFEELQALYNSLTSNEKEILSGTSVGKAALSSYNTALDQYYDLTGDIIGKISNNTGLDTWIIVVIIVSISLVVVAGAVVATYYFTKRRMVVNKAIAQSDDFKDIEDIFGIYSIEKSERKESMTKEEDIFDQNNVEKKEEASTENNEGTDDKDK